MTFPNILILDYLKRTGGGSPGARMKAEQLVSMGYQRLLTFETPGGGFDWFGMPPAKTVLTAYGLMELHDMARVAPVDPALIDRARLLLVSRQSGDGSWPVDEGLHTWSGLAGPLAATAYVTWALAHAGGAPEAVERGLGYLEGRVGDGSDAYVLALAANAFAAARPRGETVRHLLDLLDRRQRQEGSASSWATGERTLTRGGGSAASDETTALAAQAFLRAGYRTEVAERALTYLVRRRGGSGAWSTTQATILALQALVAASEGVTERGSGTIQVRVNGRDAATVRLTEQNENVAQQIDLTTFAAGGKAEVSFEPHGRLHPLYQLVTRAYVPHRPAPPVPPTVAIRVAYDRTELRQNDVMTARVTVRSNARQPLSMLIVDLGLAPGFAPEPESLEALVARRVADRYEVTPRQLILYLRDLPPGGEVQFPVRLRARFPVRAKAPPALVYEYYNPENRQSTGAVGVRVGA